MYSSDIFKNCKMALENCLGVRQAFQALPANIEASINIEDRIPCTLLLKDGELVLEPRKTLVADIEFILFSESIRRLNSTRPDYIPTLASELLNYVLQGHARIRLLSSPITFYEKGYVSALKGLGPEIKKEFSKLLFYSLGQASSIVETLKKIISK
ncbi:MAG: hypothetical protein ABL927_05085 [Bdellovibrionales bacterium]